MRINLFIVYRIFGILKDVRDLKINEYIRFCFCKYKISSFLESVVVGENG